ncbi:hypothetical protein NDI85_11810 [Halomicroarcula sp. S1AR25-4]|uniref:hypothetical protein n=1 Tax=Haloarcula sp. S1AR25-4 TaxID=2950538 RepID=UPI002874FA08|nr:hypothetical protein [Halomicroarcula sp. S1AR25-4]MDS0278483.1 hypothetical protein [Halomicroarcula sp. S1AR25-4]
MLVWERVVVALLLLSVLGGLFVHAEVTGERRWPTPQADDLVADYDRYVGSETFMIGTVTAADGATLTVRFDSHLGPVSLTVSGVEKSPRRGATVQVAGTVGPEHTFRADRVVVVNSSSDAKLYKYGASLVGVALFLAAFVRYWRLDTTRWVLEARRDG